VCRPLRIEFSPTNWQGTQDKQDTQNPHETQQRRQAAQQRYATLVEANRDTPLWPDALRQQVYLGDETFVQRMQAHAGAPALQCAQVPLRQRADPTSLVGWLAACDSRDQAVWMAHQRSGMTLTAIAAELGLSVGRVSQLVARARGAGSGEGEGYKLKT
jgi:DNA-directed RNA polymerase specialized sigma24 family protein